MNVIILTGPAGAGKNTIARLVAEKKKKCSVIDVDLVRAMIVQPHKAPWDGEGGLAQQRLGVANACLLAKIFVKNAYDVLILDVISDETARLYKKELGDQNIITILLMPNYTEIQRRNKERPSRITEEEIKLIYNWQENLTQYDKKIDNTRLTALETAEIIGGFI